MLIKLLQIISLIFAISMVCTGLNKISGKIYRDVFKLVFKLDSPHGKVGDCELTLNGYNFGFHCTYSYNERPILIEKLNLDIHIFDGTCELNNDGVYMFTCLAETLGHRIPEYRCHNQESYNYYLENAFKQCKNFTVDIIKIRTENENYSIDFLANDLLYLEELQWHMKYNCQDENQMLQNFKHLKRLRMFVDVGNNVCKNFHFTNVTQLRKLMINVISPKNTKNNFTLDKEFLRGATHLETFMLVGSSREKSIKFDIHNESFYGLINLSQIIFLRCNILNLYSEHFHNLTNLKMLKIRGTWTNNYEWMSSKTLQNHLEHLTIDDSFINHTIIKYMRKLNTKLAIIEVDTVTGDIGWISKIKTKAFICTDLTKPCRFGVDINNKTCPYGCECYLERQEMRFIINCDRIDKLKGIPMIPIPITGIASLQLNNTNITELPNSSLYGHSNLRELTAPYNKLTYLNLHQLPPNITYLDIRNNSIQTLDKQVLAFLAKRSNILRLRLSGNPWICNCDTEAFILFVANLSHQIEDRESIKCNNESVDLREFAIQNDICLSSTNYAIIILGSLVGIAVLLLALNYFKKSIVLWLYQRNLCLTCISRPEPENVEALRIDAFLAYSHLDSTLVEEYVEKLENGPRAFKLCFYQRDWLIGESIPACILKTIDESKRIILLMTKNFVESSWGRFEFRMAIRAVSIDPRKRLIIIVYPDVTDFSDLDSELRIFLKLNTYLKRDGPQFWQKLIYAMPHYHVQDEQIGIND